MSEPVYTAGDLERPLAGRVTDAGQPVDLTAALDVKAHVVKPSGEVINRTAAVVDAEAGRWRMPWVAGDLTETGTHLVEIEVMWPGNRPQTFPPASFYVRSQLA